MNEQKPNTEPAGNVPKMEGFKTIADKLKQIAQPFWTRFTQTKLYTNKKIFYPLVISLGFLFITILIGLLFGGGKKPASVKPLNTPTPTIGPRTQTPAPSGDATTQIEQRLQQLKVQIDELDVKQSRLQPPAVDFKINF